ncbi:MAG: hypothetical protein IH866_00120 [Chloroflexi bacterium]|nr:hypothetical protein [Chloroflexota bacterium]
MGFFLFGWSIVSLPMTLILSGSMLSLGADLYQLRRLPRNIHVSEEGVTISRLFSVDKASWWQLEAVEVQTNVEVMRLRHNDGDIRLDIKALEPDDRAALVLALRARLEPLGKEVSPIKNEGLTLDKVRPVFMSAAGSVLVLAAFSVGIFSGDGPGLGLRCSVSAGYFQERFQVGKERGCVVLRVSRSAERAGIKQGDLMIEMNGIPITSGQQFSRLFEEAKKHKFTFKMLRPKEAVPRLFTVYPAQGGSSPRTPKSDPLYYYLRARSDAALGETEGPIEDYTKAIEIEPAFDLAYLYRGLLNAERDDLAAAEADITRALQLSPQLGEAHYHLARLRAAQGSLSEAIASMKDAIELHACDAGFTQYNIDCANDYYFLSQFYWLRDWTAAGEAAERSILFYPGYSEAHYLAAFAYHNSGDIESAREHARIYIAWPSSETDPEQVEFLREILNGRILSP